MGFARRAGRARALAGRSLHNASAASLAVGWDPDDFAGWAGRARAEGRSLHNASAASLAVGWDPDGFAGWAGRARALPAERSEVK
jgi:hypothetical protein